MKENFVDWFDPTNIEHIKAYNHLMDYGVWPKDFIPNNVSIPTNWSIQIVHKLAETYIKEKLNK